MTQTIKKVDNRLTLVIPDDIAELLKMKEGMSIDIQIDNEKLILVPQRRKFTLDDLLDGIPEEGYEDEWSGDGRVGREEI